MTIAPRARAEQGMRPLGDNPPMTPEIEPVALRGREPISSEITRRLVDYLVSGEVRPGERLPSERALAESFGVGRSHVRQAIRSLAVLGLVEVRQGDGTYLKRTDSPLLPLTIEWGLLLGAKRTRDMVEARQQLEVLLAGLAAERRSDEQVAEMHRLLAVMERSAGTDEFVEADVALHLEITQAAGNQSLLQVMRGIRTLLRVWVHRVVRAPGTAPATWAEHVAVVRAIELRDAQGARAAMKAHMAGARQRLQMTLPDGGGTAQTDAPLIAADGPVAPAPHAG
jgi:GntR family transcriptional repressor for pyruvate dehydrogenase complex